MGSNNEITAIFGVAMVWLSPFSTAIECGAAFVVVNIDADARYNNTVLVAFGSDLASIGLVKIRGATDGDKVSIIKYTPVLIRHIATAKIAYGRRCFFCLIESN